MKVIGINGSVRKESNTTLLINEVFKELTRVNIQTEMIELSNIKIQPCKACFTCKGKENCIYRNDDFYELFEKIKLADGIVLGSPTYLANISASMQAFLERAAVVVDMNPGLLKYKVGVAVASARRSGSLQAIDAMNHFFLNHEMLIAGSTYWNMVYGQMHGEVLNDVEGMENIKNLGQNMAFLIKKL